MEIHDEVVENSEQKIPRSDFQSGILLNFMFCSINLISALYYSCFSRRKSFAEFLAIVFS